MVLRDVRYLHRPMCYAMCPVLTYAGIREGSTVLVSSAICLRNCYVMPGTDNASWYRRKCYGSSYDGSGPCDPTVCYRAARVLIWACPTTVYCSVRIRAQRFSDAEPSLLASLLPAQGVWIAKREVASKEEEVEGGGTTGSISVVGSSEIVEWVMSEGVLRVMTGAGRTGGKECAVLKAVWHRGYTVFCCV
eukprot:1621897-Rhodomonas_salina.5